MGMLSKVEWIPVVLMLLVGTRLWAQEPLVLDRVAAVEDLCSVLSGAQPVAVPPGDPVTRGKARARLEESRADLLSKTYRLVLLPEEFRFEDYDPAASTLPLDLTDGLVAFGGRVELALPNVTVELHLGEAQARELADEHASRRVRLAVDFVLDATVPQPCRRQGRGPKITLAAVPTAFTWLDSAGHILFRVAGSRDEVDGPARLVDRARVKVAMARVLTVPGATMEVESRLLPGLVPCLRERILQTGRPIEGSLVLEIVSNQEDHTRQVLVRRRLLGDDELLKCTVRAVERADIPWPARGVQRLSVPIFFQSIF